MSDSPSVAPQIKTSIKFNQLWVIDAENHVFKTFSTLDLSVRKAMFEQIRLSTLILILILLVCVLICLFVYMFICLCLLLPLLLFCLFTISEIRPHPSIHHYDVNTKQTNKQTSLALLCTK